MISRIAAVLSAFIGGAIVRISGAERTQSHRCQQLLLNRLYHSASAFSRKHGMVQADGENLVWTNRSIRRTAVDNVIEALRVLVPENPIEGPAGESCQTGIFFPSFFIVKTRGQVFHDAQSVIPERLDLNWLAASRRHHPV